MTENVIDGFKVIKIDKHQTKGLTGSCSAQNFNFQLFLKNVFYIVLLIHQQDLAFVSNDNHFKASKGVRGYYPPD
jgi:hypothetical protein